MALTWTSATDVTDRWVGTDPIPATTDQIEVLLEDAEDVILREFPDIEDRIEAGTTPVRRVRKVAARMVIRHLHNPAAVRQMQSTAGPYQEGFTYGGETPGEIVLTDEDRAELGGVKGRRAFMIDTTPAAVRNGTFDAAPDPWGST